MTPFRFLLSLLLVPAALTAQVYSAREPLAHTYSIVARDSVTGELAVAVQSHWFSVGTSVSWAEAGVGAIATQSFTNKSFGPRGLGMLRSGLTARQTLDSLLSDDPGREVRQVAVVDRMGNVAVHTGSGCIDAAGHIRGNGFSAQANMMLRKGVPEAMAAAFRKTAGKPLAERMIAALKAAEATGGDIRGRQSAALLVVPARSAGKPWEERTVDLRVDDATDPLTELDRLYRVHTAYQHMNEGDLLVEVKDMNGAMREYRAAMGLFPKNLEMKYWTAVTLANNGKLSEAASLFKSVFAADKNWKELTRRLPKVGLLTVNEEELKNILAY